MKHRSAKVQTLMAVLTIALQTKELRRFGSTGMKDHISTTQELETGKFVANKNMMINNLTADNLTKIF